MASKKFSADILSVKSIEKLKKNLQEYRDSLEYKCRLVAEKLADNGVEVARVQLADLNAVFKGELIASIHREYVTSQKGGVVLAVVAGTEHCAFVEFGTGIIGQESPYTGTLPEGVTWEYASGKTIRQLTDGRYGWFYPADDGKWYFTQGMPSRPFMYNTANILRDKVMETVKEVFG